MELNKNYLVSVIIPTYKRTEYLRLTLESILNQTYSNFEIIVIDDGTPNDDNELLCKNFEKVKYIKISNSGGPAKPRNIGIKEARGKYLAFVDDDDIWLPTKLQKQIEVLEQNPNFGVAHGCCEIIDKDGNLMGKIIGRPGSLDVKHGDVSLKMVGNWTLMMPTTFARREVVERVGFFNEKIPPALEDVEFWSRCSFETKFYYLDEPLVYYRVHDNNISGDTDKYIDLSLYLKNILIEQLKTNKISKKQYLFLLNRLCQMQIRNIRQNFFKTIFNLFSLNVFWMFGKNNMKLLVNIFLKKTKQN